MLIRIGGFMALFKRYRKKNGAQKQKDMMEAHRISAENYRLTEEVRNLRERLIESEKNRFPPPETISIEGKKFHVTDIYIGFSIYMTSLDGSVCSPLYIGTKAGFTALRDAVDEIIRHEKTGKDIRLNKDRQDIKVKR